MFIFRTLGLFLIVVATSFSANLGKNFSMQNPSSASLMNQEIIVAPGMKMVVGDFILQSNLKKQPKFEAYFNKKFQTQFLKAEPEYTEFVEAKNDKIVITRKLVIDPIDPCSTQMQKGRGINNVAPISLCFKKSQKLMPDDIKNQFKKELSAIREKVKNSNQMRAEKKAKIVAMSDEELTDFILNKNDEPREIIHESIMPLVVYKTLNPQLLNLQQQNFSIPTANQYSLNQVDNSYSQNILVKSSTNAMFQANKNILGVQKLSDKKVVVNKPKKAQTFEDFKASQYSGAGLSYKEIEPTEPIVIEGASKSQTYDLLLGKTLAKNYGDSWSITFAKAKWWHDKYYAKFSYTFGYGFGLRWPFEVKINSQITSAYNEFNTVKSYPSEELTSLCPGVTNAIECANSATFSVSANGTDTSKTNSNYYSRMGLSSDKIQNGSELVFNIQAEAKLYISIPGPNLHYSIGKGFNKNDDFVPPLGNQNATLYEKMFYGEDTGLKLQFWVGVATLDLGVKLIADNGVLKLTTENYHLTHSDIPSLISFNRSSSARSFSLNTSAPIGYDKLIPWGIKLSNPKYQTTFKMVPMIGAGIGIDVAGYGWIYHIEPYELTALSVDLGEYNFETHEGTSGLIDYTVASINRQSRNN